MQQQQQQQYRLREESAALWVTLEKPASPGVHITKTRRECLVVQTSRKTKGHLRRYFPELSQHNTTQCSTSRPQPGGPTQDPLSHQLAFGAPLGERVLAHESRELPAKLPTSTATISTITIVFHSPLWSGRHPAFRGHPTRRLSAVSRPTPRNQRDAERERNEAASRVPLVRSKEPR